MSNDLCWTLVAMIVHSTKIIINNVCFSLNYLNSKVEMLIFIYNVIPIR